MTELTEPVALKRSRASSMSTIRNLNCWGCGFRDVSILSEAESLEVVNLSCNNLGSLQALSDCRNLREIFLRKNQVADFDQLLPLQQLKNLKVLWLKGNPVEKKAGYRSTVIHTLPQLTSLDGTVISEEERREAENTATLLQQQLDTADQSQESNVLRAVMCLLTELDRQELATVASAVEARLTKP